MVLVYQTSKGDEQIEDERGKGKMRLIFRRCVSSGDRLDWKNLPHIWINIYLYYGYIYPNMLK